MKSAWLHVVMVIVALVLVGCSVPLFPTPTPGPAVDQGSQSGPAADTPLPSPEPSTLPAAAGASPSPGPQTSSADPFDLISWESLLGFLEDLTAIQPYSGWRNSASEGEAEALEYVAQRLGGFAYLQSLGIDLERQSFHVFLGAELWDTQLHLTVKGQEVEVPADGLRGPRDDAGAALRFDSDGQFNDSARNPKVVQGAVVPIRSADEIRALSPTDLQGKVVFLDYAVIDRTQMTTSEAVQIASDLLEKEPAGLVLVTSFSNRQDESHGAFVGDASALNSVETDSLPLTLYVRMEDLAPARITDWDDLARIETARLTWDADIFSPATSGNLVARIPGADPSQAVILGAHIDSPNAPGAMDDGSGSAILLEVARILDAAQIQPPTDLYLAWFGSEELGLYGAAHFAATHQELLDRTLAMLQIDCLTHPLDGLRAELRLVTWPYGQLGDDRLLWPDYLAQAAAQQGVQTVPQGFYYTYSDDSTLGGFDVPHADLIYEPLVSPNKNLHNAGHLHDPYDTVDLAHNMRRVLEQMARVALAAALDTGRDQPALRVTPRPDRRALFVASHTEAVHMTPVGFTQIGMALAMEGFDVDLIPYGQAVTPADLEDADLVVVLPVFDYPGPEGDPDLYDEAWTPEEIAALEAYVAGGGLLVLANSAHRLKYGNQGLDPNEDWSDANDLASRFGITYRDGLIPGSQAQTEGEHPLIEGVTALELSADNGLPFSLAEAVQSQVLALADGEVIVALVNYGNAGGQVLVLADVGILAAGYREPSNLPFWQNLARYARR